MVCGLTRWLPRLSEGHLWMPHGTMWSASILISAPRTGSLPAGEIWAEHSVQGKWKGSPKGKALSPHNWDNFFPPQEGKAILWPWTRVLVSWGCLAVWAREREKKRESTRASTATPGCPLLQREGPSHCQTSGSFRRAACLASAGPRGRGPLTSDLFVWGCASSTPVSPPTGPQKVKSGLLLCFLLIPSLCALCPPLLHLTIVAFSHRFIDLGNSPRARIYHALVMLATVQILRPSTTGPATMHTWSKGLRSVSC